MSVPARKTNSRSHTDHPRRDANRATIDDLERLYRFRNRDVVRSYLAQHLDIVDAVAEAATVIPQFLPGHQPIELEVVRDADEDEPEGDLFAIVKTHRAPDEMRPLLGKLRREWLIPFVQRFDGRFNVGLEYQR